MSDEARQCPLSPQELRQAPNAVEGWRLLRQRGRASGTVLQVLDYIDWLEKPAPAAASEPTRAAEGSWIAVLSARPAEDQIVFVDGGIAQYRSGVFYTGMEEPRYARPIKWTVTHWMPIRLHLNTGHDAGCAIHHFVGAQCSCSQYAQPAAPQSELRVTLTREKVQKMIGSWIESKDNVTNSVIASLRELGIEVTYK